MLFTRYRVYLLKNVIIFNGLNYEYFMNFRLIYDIDKNISNFLS